MRQASILMPEERAGMMPLQSSPETFDIFLSIVYSISLNCFTIFLSIFLQYFSQLFVNIFLNRVTEFLSIVWQCFSSESFAHFKLHLCGDEISIDMALLLSSIRKSKRDQIDLVVPKWNISQTLNLSSDNQHLNMSVLFAFRLIQDGFSPPVSLFLVSLKCVK